MGSLNLKILLLFLVVPFLSCEYVGLPNYTVRDHIKIYCLDNDECPDQSEVEQFFDIEEDIWQEECNVSMESGTQRYNRLKISFWSLSEYHPNVLGRYFPSCNCIDVDYPNELWVDVLRHEVGLSVAHAELGNIGEAAKVEWYQCHPLL